MSGHSQRIAILVDGSSQHREASRRSGEAIAHALAERGHEGRPLYVDEHVDLGLRQGRFDVAFLALRGSQGADGRLQGLLEWLGIPYTGPGVLAAALCMDQEKAREVLRLASLPIAPGYVLRGRALRALGDRHRGFGFPVAVGPADAGLTCGVGLARDELELEAAIEESLRFGDEVLVERFVDGHTIAVALLDGEALGFIDLGQRRGSFGPAGLPNAGPAGARATRPRPAAGAPHPSWLRLAERSVSALKLSGPALVELCVSERDNEIVRGVDGAPLLTPNSVYGRIAATAGLGFVELCEEVLAGARLHQRRPACDCSDVITPYDEAAPSGGRPTPFALPH
jgi:D-alanine-D-alanine ligase